MIKTKKKIKILLLCFHLGRKSATRFSLNYSWPFDEVSCSSQNIHFFKKKLLEAPSESLSQQTNAAFLLQCLITYVHLFKTFPAVKYSHLKKSCKSLFLALSLIALTGKISSECFFRHCFLDFLKFIFVQEMYKKLYQCTGEWVKVTR